MIMDLIEKTQGIPGFISFAGGSPSAETFPKKHLGQLFKQVIEEKGDDILQYGSSGGDKELKQAIIKEEGLSVGLDEMQICSGAANGIYNAMRTLIDPGDIIIVESPTFLGSLVTFEAAGAKILPVAMQADGMDLDQLNDLIRKHGSKKIKFIYTIPDFQNPTGLTMSLEKREELVEIALKNEIFILEDDPYSKLRLAGTPIDSIFEIAGKKYHSQMLVIAIRSFSKLLGPGLRIAYALADKKIINYMDSWLQKVNNTTERVSQQAVAAFLDKGLLSSHKMLITETYRPLLKQIITSLQAHMPYDIKWVNPQGGMFLWLELPEDLNTDELFDKAVEQKVAFLPGSKFYPTGYEKHNGLRLNFTFPTKEQIDEGIKRLSKAVKILMSSPNSGFHFLD